MPIRYPDILELRRGPTVREWDRKDAILYALAIGFGGDPMAPESLAYVYEKDLKVAPTFAAAVAWDCGIKARDLGCARAFSVHADQEMVFHGPLPAAGTVVGEGRVRAVYDKGASGTLIEMEIVLRAPDGGEPLVTMTVGVFARGDRDTGAPRGRTARSWVRPGRTPDRSVTMPTAPNQALLYRLCGDRNPLHADPVAAGGAGFPRPILHGMCTYGIAARAILETFADHDPARLRSLYARFSSPVFPGEKVTFDFWREGRAVLYEARIVARDVVVLSNGYAELDSQL